MVVAKHPSMSLGNVGEVIGGNKIDNSVRGRDCCLKVGHLTGSSDTSR